MDLHDRPIMRPQRLTVAARLRVDELPERVRPVGDRSIDRVLRGELQEDAGGRAALVELAGRVQEARAVARGRRAARSTERGAEPGDRVIDVGRWRDERLDRDVARDRERAERRTQELGKARGVMGRDPDPAFVVVDRARVRVASGAGTCEHAAGALLGLLDVRLVERVDAQDRARERGRDLPASHLAGQIDRVVELDLDNRMAGRAKLAEEALPIAPCRAIAVDEGEVHECPIRSISGSVANGLQVDRDDAHAVLARGLRDELLCPRAEARDRRVGQECQLVAPVARQAADDQAEEQPGIGADPRLAAGGKHLRARAEERVDVDPDE